LIHTYTRVKFYKPKLRELRNLSDDTIKSCLGLHSLKYWNSDLPSIQQYRMIDIVAWLIYIHNQLFNLVNLQFILLFRWTLCRAT
jgi:hypothetical protein